MCVCPLTRKIIPKTDRMLQHVAFPGLTKVFMVRDVRCVVKGRKRKRRKKRETVEGDGKK
jgi:hypothetical protein